MRNIILIGLIIFCFSYSSAQTANDYFKLGLQELNSGNYNRAIENFNLVISIEPSRAEAYAQRAYAKSKLFLYAQSLDDYNKAYQYSPNDIWLLNNRGATFIKLGQYQNAVLDFDRSIQLNDQQALAYMLRGDAKYQSLRFGSRAKKPYSYFEIVSDLSQALSLNHDLAFAFYRRGQARLDSINSDSLVADFTEVEAICEDWLLAANLGLEEAFGLLKSRCGLKKKALITEQVLRVAQIREQERDFYKALHLFNLIINNESPEKTIYQEALFSRAAIYLEIDQGIKAQQDYDALIDMMSIPPLHRGKAHYLRGRVRFQNKENEGAMEDFNSALQLGYQFSWVYLARAELNFILGNGEMACQDWANAEKKGNQQAAERLRKNCKISFFKKLGK